MKTYNKKDELLIKIGTSIRIRILSNGVDVTESLKNINYSNADGFNKINIGLEFALAEIAKNFGNNKNSDKVRIGEYMEALENRINWLIEKGDK